MKNSMTIDGKQVSIGDERNLLELIRAKTNTEIPTFCYHSELSVYGACRLCIVDIEGRGVMTSCSIKPEPGLVVRTNTAQIRKMRKITIELLLASYDHNCTTCQKNNSCKLQELALRLGVDKIRFKQSPDRHPIDNSSYAITRDPNKCILCGDCVRACDEIQGIGAIDFISRGANVMVSPAFGKGISKVDCIDCGQCARVCPTGALLPHSEVAEVWKEIEDENKVVVAQIAPAVRVAVGELFGMKPGEVLTGQIVAALKLIGFDKVFDTSYTADLTVIEEANEFLTRKTQGGKLPQFTSCCPGWVKYAEQYYPELLPNLSSCKSPQQMFGSVVKELMPEMTGKDKKDIVMVSIMPCTAKKVEARRDEFIHDGIAEVDYVLTTQELAAMIKQAGIKFNQLSPEALDMPFGFKTGAGILFGNSGGVTEAVLRYAYEKVSGVTLENVDFTDVRGNEGIKEATVSIDGVDVKICIVHGLKNAKKIVNDVKSGKADYDFIEVMSCPGGCIGGAGQPVYYDEDIRKARTKGIYDADKMVQLHKPQENPYITELYKNHLGEINGTKAHGLLHTHYHNRKRISEGSMALINSENSKLEVSVCVGTNCFIRGSQDILRKMIHHVENNNLDEIVDIRANFCMENCDQGPSVTIGEKLIKHCTFENALNELQNQLESIESHV